SFPAEAYRSDALVGRNLRAAAWVSACSAAVLETAKNYVPEVAATGTVVLNALPLVENRAATANPRRNHLLYVGRLVPHKGVDTLIAAMALLAPHYPDLRLTIVGEGEARGALQGDAARLAITERVVFAGSVPHARVYEEMASAVMVVVPSRIEPFGLVALEAAQMGRPVVAAAIGGLPEIVIDGETGLLVAPDDPPALAGAIATLLDDPQRADRLGEAARRRALEHFRWDRFVDTYDAALTRIAFR
ncbi:MAG: glycosyltransferase family 4 protein, partial [Bauldia sp.]